MRPAAIVLCGGESRRMGRPKAWLPFGDELMLQRVVRLAATVARPVVVAAAAGQELPEIPEGVMIVRDRIAGKGPLQGLAAGLAAVPERVGLVYAMAADVPFLEPRWICRLAELAEGYDLVIPHVDDRYQPLAALYRTEPALRAVERLLAENRLRTGFLIEMLRTRVVDEAELRSVDPALGTVRNINTPEEYAAALELAGFPRPRPEPGT